MKKKRVIGLDERISMEMPSKAPVMTSKVPRSRFFTQKIDLDSSESEHND
jgi:hypothetical protein